MRQIWWLLVFFTLSLRWWIRIPRSSLPLWEMTSGIYCIQWEWHGLQLIHVPVSDYGGVWRTYVWSGHFSASPCFLQTPVRCWVLRCSLLLRAVACSQCWFSGFPLRALFPSVVVRHKMLCIMPAWTRGTFTRRHCGRARRRWMHFALCSSIVGRPTVCLHHGRYGPVRCFLLACLWYPWSRQ